MYINNIPVPDTWKHVHRYSDHTLKAFVKGLQILWRVKGYAVACPVVFIIQY